VENAGIFFIMTANHFLKSPVQQDTGNNTMQSVALKRYKKSISSECITITIAMEPLAQSSFFLQQNHASDQPGIITTGISTGYAIQTPGAV